MLIKYLAICLILSCCLLGCKSTDSYDSYEPTQTYEPAARATPAVESQKPVVESAQPYNPPVVEAPTPVVEAPTPVVEAPTPVVEAPTPTAPAELAAPTPKIQPITPTSGGLGALHEGDESGESTATDEPIATGDRSEIMAQILDEEFRKLDVQFSQSDLQEMVQKSYAEWQPLEDNALREEIRTKVRKTYVSYLVKEQLQKFDVQISTGETRELGDKIYERCLSDRDFKGILENPDLTVEQLKPINLFIRSLCIMVFIEENYPEQRAKAEQIALVLVAYEVKELKREMTKEELGKAIEALARE